jgi:hypothetical protein
MVAIRVTKLNDNDQQLFTISVGFTESCYEEVYMILLSFNLFCSDLFLGYLHVGKYFKF